MSHETVQVKRSLFDPLQFLYFFLLCSFVVSCSFLLFLTGMELPREVLDDRAPITFLNVLVISALFTAVDLIQKVFRIRRPVREILAATQKLRRGDFSVSIPIRHVLRSTNELDVIAEDINQLARELAGIETLRTDFISNVSHELKTPLAVLQNYATMLQSPNLTEEMRQEYAAQIAATTRRLSSLVTNILKLNKLENQQIYPQVTRYELGEQLCACLLDFESVWEEKQLELETALQEDVFITADEELLSLVWNNLFSNAMKFTDPGGRVSVSLHTEGEFAVVSVEDTGCGIRPEAGARIFEKFYQGDTSHATQGNGLGLALVKRVVDITQGEILVSSTPGKGSTFTVRLRRDTP